MKILHIHNSYVESGGEDGVVDEQIELLKEQGHSVTVYKRSNKELKELSFVKRLKFLFNDALWSSKNYLELKDLIREHKPDVAIVHNIFYVITPSVYVACHEEGVPIIQCFHNYRWLLAPAKRNNFPEFNPTSIQSFILNCFLVPRILKKLAKEKIFEEKVRKFVCLCEFSKRVFVDNGFQEEKISVIPPYVSLSDNNREEVGRYALFVGRLAEYKGIRVLLEAMKLLEGCHLRIIGDGPLRSEVEAAAKKDKNIDYLGSLPHQEMLNEMKKSAFLVFPSLCYETFGKVLIEAFSYSVPVLASSQTSAEEIVEEGKTGLLFSSNDSTDLAEKMKMLLEDPTMVKEMGEHARKVCEEKYTKKINYEKLMALYEELLETKVNEKTHQSV